MEQAGVEQVRRLPLELRSPQAAGKLGGRSDKWNAGKGGKNRRTGWNCFYFSFSVLVPIFSRRPTPLDKFAETGWRWLFYFTAHVVRSTNLNISNLTSDVRSKPYKGSFTCGLVKQIQNTKSRCKSRLYSVGALWDRPWVWNTAHCWYNYPFHPLGMSLCNTAGYSQLSF